MSGDDSKPQFATLEQAHQLGERIASLSEDVKNVQDNITEMRGWLEGDYSATGVPRPGVLSKVDSIDRVGKSIRRLLMAIVVALLINAVSGQWAAIAATLWPTTPHHLSSSRSR